MTWKQKWRKLFVLCIRKLICLHGIFWWFKQILQVLLNQYYQVLHTKTPKSLFVIKYFGGMKYHLCVDTFLVLSLRSAAAVIIVNILMYYSRGITFKPGFSFKPWFVVLDPSRLFCSFIACSSSMVS